VRSTGVVRKIDELGRIVLPIEMRRTHGIHKGDPMETFIDGERIILKKYEPTCVF
jgi:transcriptional pleiotropic regulator of transition state genes